MLQVVLEKPEQFAVREAEAPTGDAENALVRVNRIGVCGTDMHAYFGRHPYIRYPVVLGHELSGTIVQLPSGSSKLNVGDHVSIEPFRSCGDCHACNLGKSNCCLKMALIGIHIDGGMQPLIRVLPQYLYSSSRLTLDQLAMIEPLSIGSHAVQRARLKEGESVLVVGAGPIGIATAQFALLAGTSVTVMELNEERREWVSKHLAVEVTADSGDECYEVVFDATGNPKAMEKSFERCAHGGKLVFVGIIKARIGFDDELLHGRELTLFASRNSCGDFPRIIKLIEQGRFDPSPWVTHRMRLAEVPSRFTELFDTGGLIKAMIEVPEEQELP